MSIEAGNGGLTPVYVAGAPVDQEPALDQQSNLNMNDGSPQPPSMADGGPSTNAGPTTASSVELDRIHRVLSGVGDVVYEWDIADDRLSWAGNVAQALGVADAKTISTGRQFAVLLDPDNTTNRYDAVMDTGMVDEGDGVAFQVTYRILTKGRESDEGCWIEDTGRWYAGEDGQPGRVVGVVRRVDERHETEQQLKHLSYFDPLTGDLNRTRLAEALKQAIEAIEPQKQSCAFLLVAIDHLAMINDAFGFDVADQVIAAVSMRLKSRMRAGDIIGRYAGNKFGLVLHDCNDNDMEIAANRLLDVVRRSVIDTAVGPVAATISIGAVALPKQAREMQECLTRAEEALEQAKNRHLEGFVAYTHSEKRESIRKRNIMFADEIVTALNDRRLNIAYQPIVDINTQQPAFYESLLRMTKPDGTVVSAGHFISVAEQIGLVRMIDHRVFELVFNTLQDHPDLNLTFNVSGVTANDPEWLANFNACVRAKPDIARRLTVEITETAAIQDVEETASFVSTVRDLGCKVAIDDFGAGYTSFRNLQLLDIDMVKIDGTFVDKLHENPDNQFFVRTLIDLAKNFDIKTVAEWVCDERDVALLREMGIDYMQGFLFGAASLEVPGTSAIPQQAAQPQIMANGVS